MEWALKVARDQGTCKEMIVILIEKQLRWQGHIKWTPGSWHWSRAVYKREPYHMRIQGWRVVSFYSIYPTEYHVMITIRLPWHAFCIFPSCSCIEFGPNGWMKGKQCNLRIWIILIQLKIPPLFPRQKSNYIFSL